MPRTPRSALIALGLALTLTLLGCSGDDDDEPAGTATTESNGGDDDGGPAALTPEAEAYCDTLRELLTLDFVSEKDRPRVLELLDDLSDASDDELAGHIEHLREVALEVGVDQIAFNKLLAEDPALPKALVAIETYSIESCDEAEVLPD